MDYVRLFKNTFQICKKEKLIICASLISYSKLWLSCRTHSNCYFLWFLSL